MLDLLLTAATPLDDLIIFSCLFFCLIFHSVLHVSSIMQASRKLSQTPLAARASLVQGGFSPGYQRQPAVLQRLPDPPNMQCEDSLYMHGTLSPQNIGRKGLRA